MSMQFLQNTKIWSIRSEELANNDVTWARLIGVESSKRFPISSSFLTCIFIVSLKGAKKGQEVDIY